MSVRRERKREEVGSVGIHSGLEACEGGEEERGEVRKGGKGERHPTRRGDEP